MPRNIRLPVCLLLLTALLGLIVAPDRTLALNRAAVLVAGVLVFAVTAFAARSPRRFRAAALVFLLAGLAAALLSLVVTDWSAGELAGAITNPLNFPVLVRLPGTGVPNAAQGANPRMVSGAMALFLPLACSALFFARQRRLRWLGGLALPLLLFPLALSQSPQGWLALALGLGLALAWRFPWALAAEAVLALAAGLSWSAWHWGLPAVLVARLELGVQARLSIWPGAWRMLLDMPFTGSGLNNFPVIYPLYGVTNTIQPHAHNVFLQTANDLGVFGLVAFLALFAWAFLAGWRAYHASQDPDLRAVMLGCAGGCAAFLGYGLWDSMTLGNVPAVAVWAMLGLLAAGERLAEAPRRPWLSPRARRRLLAGLAVLALLAAPLWGSSLLVNLGRAAYDRSQVQAAADPGLARLAGAYSGLALKLNPYNSRAYLLAGLAQLQAGDAHAGSASLESAVSLDPADARAQYWLAEASHALGDDVGAVTAWRLAGAAGVLVQRGAAASRAGQYGEAEGWYRLAAEVDPHKLQAWLGLGRAQAAQKNYASARQSYGEALQCSPAASGGYEELAGLLYWQVKDPAQARQVIEQGLASAHPPGTQLYYLRSKIEADQKDWTAAESDAAQAIALTPTSGTYQAWLGDLYMKEALYPQALAQYTHLADIPGWGWQAGQRVAGLYAAQGEWTTAADQYRSAIANALAQKAAPASLAQLYAGLGKALQKTGSLPEAEAACQTALQYDPSNQAARQLLAEIRVK